MGRARTKLEMPEGFEDPGLPKGTFSHSQYSLYKKCGEAYRLRYVDNKPSPPNPNMVRGVTIHSLVEHSIREKIAGRLASLEEVRDLARDEFALNSADVADWGEEKPDQVERAVMDAYTAYHTYALPKLRPLAVEAGFAVKVGDVPMVGYIDLVDQVPMVADEPDAPLRSVVVDLKTTTKSWSQDQVDRSPQLTLYVHAIATSDVRIDQLVQLKKGTEYRPLVSQRSPDQKAVYVEDLNETAALIKQGVFPKAALDGWGCGPDACSYWSQCRGKKR